MNRQSLTMLIIGLIFGAGGFYFFGNRAALQNGAMRDGVEKAEKTVMEKSAGATLGEVRERGYIVCGVSQGLPGFSNTDDRGDWSGLDVDFCRAMSAAIFGEDDKIRFKGLDAKDRFTALQTGEIDVLARNTTWTMSRDVALGLTFIGVNYYDGQGFMVPKKLGVESAYKLDNVTACSNAGTTTELNVADFFRANNLSYNILTFAKSEETVAAYDAGRCDVYTTDRSGLAAQRSKLTDPEAHVVLPEVISKEPLGPLVRQGDDQWADIARWVLNAMKIAEEFGITSENIDSFRSGDNPEIRRFLGEDGNFGESLGLANDWAYNIVSEVGNYGESYAQHVGPNTPLGLERGLNALWTRDGLMYAPPIR